MYKEKRESIIDKLIEFIYQLSVKNVKVVVRILKELICFIKRNKRKQLTLPVIVIKLDNNSWTDTWVLIDSEYTRFCINQ